MISNLIPGEATHSSLDLFEKPPLLVTFENAFTLKIGPSYSPDGHMLEFEVLSDRNNFIDLQRTRLEIVAQIVRSNENVFRTHATEAANRDTPYFVSNPLSSLFTECTLTLNGEKISTTNGNFAHKGLLRPIFHTVMMPRKHGWLVKVIIMKKTHQLLTVLERELMMLRSVKVSLRPRTS